MPIIRASEVGEYVYCARAWWLRRVAGLEPAGRQRRAQGIVRHAQHGRRVQISTMLLASAGLLFLLAIVMLLTR